MASAAKGSGSFGARATSVRVAGRLAVVAVGVGRPARRVRGAAGKKGKGARGEY